MDKIESLSQTISSLTFYDLKSMYNQAKNVVLNVSEMEAKVRDATNEDPWGASSTLMGEIAQGTFNFAQFNEIMPCIYGRFMEKEARQWRQIYKALQLLEYLVKNGSERVVDDARSHIGTIKMLRNFHYIDDKGKDEGINVRNRAKELVELLSDVEKIRSERRKAKTNKNKFTGVGNDGFGFGGSSGQYGGFGSDSFSGANSVSDYYQSGGGSSSYGGSGSRSSYNDNSSDRRRRQYDEYDAGGDEVAVPARASTSTRTPARRSTAPTAAPAPPPSAPVEDLLGGLDDDFGPSVTAPAPAPPATNKALPAVQPVSIDDDDFADFQAAPVQAPPAAPAVGIAQGNAKLMDLLNSSSPPSRPLGQATPPAFAPVQPVQAQPPPGYGVALGAHRPSPSFSSPSSQFSSPLQPQGVQQQFGGMRPAAQSQSSFGSVASQGSIPRPTTTPATTAPKPASSANFDDLWSMSLGSTSKPTAPASGGSKSIQEIQKEKALASIWGSGGQQQQQGKPLAPSQPAFPAFGGSSAPANGGGDDLLL